MRARIWKLNSMGDDVRIELLSSASADADANRASEREVDALLMRGSEPRVRGVLDDVYAALRNDGTRTSTRGSSAPPSSFAPSIREDLRFAAYSGALKVERIKRASVVLRTNEAPDEALGPESTPEPTLTWIAVALVDQDGAPVPNVRYSITCSDGSVSEGMLDAKGKARVDGIVAGSCTVSFPDIDAAEYQAA